MVKCKQCKKTIIGNSSWLKRAIFCSRSCSSTYHFTGERNPFFGKTHTAKNKTKIGENSSKCQRGKRSKNWKGGLVKGCHGYIKIYIPEHPFAVHGYVLHHRYVMETHLGRILDKKEVVHHINGIRDDNSIENLTVLSRSEHTRLHRLEKNIK